MKRNYLFGPFIGETIYELNYFVGHAIYLRKQNPQNRVIVLTRKENFDLYGKYATTLLKLPLNEDLIPKGFSCKNVRATLFDELVRRFELKYKNKFKINDHFYPQVTTYLKDLKWYYPRNEVDFDFKPRSRNAEIAQDIIRDRNIILSDFHNHFGSKEMTYKIFPVRYPLCDLDLKNVDNASPIGILIEMIRRSKYIYADLDSLTGRLAMLISRPLITNRNFIDAQELNPINPYASIVIGCQKLKDGVKYLEKMHENNI